MSACGECGEGKGPVGKGYRSGMHRRGEGYIRGREERHSPLEAVREKGWGTRGGCRMSRRYTDCEGRTVSDPL